jgi:glycosyltransferase involved in cell wall biosynthesis
MRIGFIAPPWLPVPPDSYGGTESVIDRLARGMHRRGHDVLLFTTGDSTCPVPKAWVYDQPPPMPIGDAVTELHHLIHGYTAVAECDIVHDHTIFGPAYAAGRFPDLPIVTTNHGPFSPPMQDIYRASARRASIIAISQSQADSAGDVPIARVIHHGIDVESVPVGSGDGGYVAYLGRMAPEKGAREAALVARRAGVRLLMAAKMNEPAEHAYFESAVKPLLGGDIEYVGELGGMDKTDLLGGASALLNPISWPEPFGLVMIEALACGTPVLACPLGAASEIVEDRVTGFLRPTLSGLVAAVDAAGSLDRRACRSAAERQFSTERMVDEHLELFRRLVPPQPVDLTNFAEQSAAQRHRKAAVTTLAEAVHS